MRQFCLSLVIFLSTAVALFSDEIKPGDKAPVLNGVTYVKGGEPKPLDGGIVSVVELWATWCGPCRTSIPHLTKLQKQYGNELQIIGLTEEAAPTVTPFVEEFGERMDYIVGAAASSSYTTYGEGIQGIPFAYIINGEGIVQWKGHPMGMDEVLDQIIKGTFDAEAAAAIANAEANLQATFASNDIERINLANKTLLNLDPTNSTGLNVGMRIAELNNDRDAFKALFNKVPSTELDGGKAAKLLEMMLGYSDQSFIDPATVRALYTQTISENTITGINLTAAKAAHFLGDIQSALELAKQGVSEQEAGAEDYVTLFEGILQK